MLPIKAPRDPAPSRIKYRLERLWLRPAIRNSVRIGLPLLAVAWAGLTLARDPAVQAAAAERIAALRQTIATHPGLMVTRVEIDGMSPALEGAVTAAMGVTMPVSSMDIDLAAIQHRIAALDAVASAHVRVEGGGLLKVTVTERVPRILWRNADGLEMLDAQGVRVGDVAERADRADLPLIAGQGANAAVPEALRLLALAGPVASELRGLVRVGERRWTLVLENDIEIMLPEEGAAAALARVMALDAAEDILARDLVAVDMRDGRRPILRLTPEALLELRRGRGLTGEEDA